MRSLPEPPPRLAGATCAILSSGSTLAAAAATRSLFDREVDDVTELSLTRSMRSTTAALERAAASATAASAAAIAATGSLKAPGMAE